MMSRTISIRILWFITITYWLFIFVMTHIPSAKVPDANVGDKLAHFIAYGVLATLLFIAMWVQNPRSWRMVWIIPLIAAAYGAVDEWLQAVPIIKRSCELADWYADVIGALIAVTLCALIKLLAAIKQKKSAI